MASKKILLGVGVLAAVAIVFCAVIGWPPVAKNDTQGAIGVAKKYQAEQISDQDVVLADQDVQSFLQTDFFYQLVTDSDFQKLYLNGVLGKALVAVPGGMGDHVTSTLPSTSSDGKVTTNIAAGAKTDVAAGVAAHDGVKALDAHQVASLTDLGKALVDQAVAQHMAAGKFDLAAETAQGKQLNVTAADLQKFDMQTLGAKGEDIAALGRLLQKDSFQKAIPYSGTLQKIMVQSGTFKNAVQSGNMSKFGQDIVGAKKKAPKTQPGYCGVNKGRCRPCGIFPFLRRHRETPHLHRPHRRLPGWRRNGPGPNARPENRGRVPGL